VGLAGIAGLIAYHRPAFDLGLIVAVETEGFPGVRIVGFAPLAKIDVLFDQVHSIRLGHKLAVSLAAPRWFLLRVRVLEGDTLPILYRAKHYPRDPLGGLP
jgi:hypothetical protein